MRDHTSTAPHDTAIQRGDKMSCRSGVIALALAAYAPACAPALADTHWVGTLYLLGEGNIYKDEAKLDLEFTVDETGKVAGNGTAVITPSPRVFVESDNCTFIHTVTPNTFDIAVQGRRDSNDILLNVRSLTTATLWISVSGGPGRNCKPTSGSAVSGMDPFAGLAIGVSVVKFRVRSASFAGNTGHETIPGGFVMDWELHVQCHDCCQKALPPAFVFLGGLHIAAHKEASSESPVTWVPPHGARVMFTDVQERGGTPWYYVTAGPLAGWVPSNQVSCDRPGPLPPGKKLYLRDTGLGIGSPTWCNCSAGNG